MADMREQLELVPDGRRRRHLTGKQEAVLRGLLAGKMLKAIGADLGMGQSTVSSHVKRICAKMGVRTTRELIAMCIAGNASGPEVARLRAEVKSLEAWRRQMTAEIEQVCAHRDRLAQEIEEMRRQSHRGGA